MKACSGTYFILVIENIEENSVIACATLVVEQKFIHECGSVSAVLLILLFIIMFENKIRYQDHKKIFVFYFREVALRM